MFTRWKRSNEVVWEELNGEALVVDAARKSAWVLNAPATHIWKNCERCGIDEFVSEFARAGNRNIRQVESDVLSCIEALRTCGLFTTSSEAQAMPSLEAATAFRGSYLTPSFQPRSLGAGPRRRPSPRGNSSPG